MSVTMPMRMKEWDLEESYRRLDTPERLMTQAYRFKRVAEKRDRKDTRDLYYTRAGWWLERYIKAMKGEY